ncbi:MAG: IS1595 family transposase [Verrucomicrobiia bacterium]
MKTESTFGTLAEFLDHFKDEETCHKHFAAIRFRHGEYCPHCGHTKIYTFAGGKKYRCAKCKQNFTIKTGTVFGESKLPLRKWFIAIYLLSTTSKGISSVQLAKHVGVTQKTGWFMDHRIRKAMKENKGQLFGEVEVDETFVGGLAKNMHKSKKKHLGTGGAGKVPVMGILQRKGKIIAGVVENVQAKTLVPKIHQHVEPGSAVFTDQWVGYNGLHSHFAHESIDHQKKCFAVGKVHTQGIDSFWALFKRGYHGIYHQMSPKHLQRYVDEFAFRFDRRAAALCEKFSDVVDLVSKSTKLSYKELIA